MAEIIKYDTKILVELEAKLVERSKAAGELGKGVWSQMLSGPAGSAVGSAPGSDTGKLRDSLAVQLSANPVTGIGFTIKPDDPVQMAVLIRLTRGYYGTDKSGRTYHEGARPSAAKAMMEAGPEMLAVMFKAIF